MQVVLTLRSRHCWKDALLTSIYNTQRDHSKGFTLSLSLSICLCPLLTADDLNYLFFFPPLGSLRISEVNFLDSPHLLRVLVKLLEPYALLCSIGMVFKIKLSTLIILPPFPGFSCPRLMNFVQLFFHALVISAFVLAPSLFLKRSSVHLSSVSSVTQSCPTLCHPMDCGRPGFPIHYQCLELAQTHVH